MYDVIVVGQGLSGMLSAIWLKKMGKSVAIVHQGTGRIIQSTGLMDILSGTNGNIEQMINEFQVNDWNNAFIQDGLSSYKSLIDSLGYPYQGDEKSPVEVITGSGLLKWTGLYPETVNPIPKKGHLLIVSFKEVGDFQSAYAKGNLQKERPELKIDTVTVSLGKTSFRTMTQLDAGKLLEKQEVRNSVIKQIKEKLKTMSSTKPDLFVFPSALGVMEWKTVIKDLKEQLGTSITEAVGMPPNATAVRLNELLRKEMIRLGVRQYADTTVIGSLVKNDEIKQLTMINSGKTQLLDAKKYILASGGILGGGLEKTDNGLIEKAFGLNINQNGKYNKTISNLFIVGATQGSHVTRYGITGGIYSILSSYEAVSFINDANNRNYTIKGGDKAC